MEEKCKRCRYKQRPKHVFPCSKCLEDKLSCEPITCKDCRYSWYSCHKRGKNESRMRICDEFKWS